MKISAIIKNNEPISSLTHFVGWGLSIAALVFLIIRAVQYGTAWHIVSFSIFGSSMVLLYLASTLYHIIPRSSKFKIIFSRIDLSLIFLLIAGTYTPLTLLPLRGSWGWTLFGIAWGLALAGITIQILKLQIATWKNVALYLAMGWLALFILPVLFESISTAGFFWLLAGGLFYTIGVIFFGIGGKTYYYRRFGMHEIFHLFVMAGSFSHFWLIYNFI